MRSLGHDVAQDFLDPGRCLLLQAVDVDGPGQGEDDHLVELFRLAVEDSAGFAAFRRGYEASFLFSPDTPKK